MQLGCSTKGDSLSKINSYIIKTKQQTTKTILIILHLKYWLLSTQHTATNIQEGDKDKDM